MDIQVSEDTNDLSVSRNSLGLLDLVLVEDEGQYVRHQLSTKQEEWLFDVFYGVNHEYIFGKVTNEEVEKEFTRVLQLEDRIQRIVEVKVLTRDNDTRELTIRVVLIVKDVEMVVIVSV